MKLREVRLKRVREDAGMSRAELARRAEMQGSTITNIESGRFIPYEKQLAKIASVLNVEDPESLLEPLEA